MAHVVVLLWKCAYSLNISQNIITYIVSLGRHPGDEWPAQATTQNGSSSEMHIAGIADSLVWHMQQDSVKASATSQCILWLSQSCCVRSQSCCARSQGCRVMSQDCWMTN